MAKPLFKMRLSTRISTTHVVAGTMWTNDVADTWLADRLLQPLQPLHSTFRRSKQVNVNELREEEHSFRELSPVLENACYKASHSYDTVINAVSALSALPNHF